jgi:hypothetical protein
MKKLLIGSALIMLGTSALASDWVKISESDSFISLYDRQSVSRRGSIITTWLLDNYSSIQRNKDGSEYLSEKKLTDFDCTNSRFRTRYYVDYARTEGGGEVTYSLTVSASEAPWNMVVPDSVGEAKINFLCKTYLKK